MSTTVGMGLRPPSSNGAVNWDVDNDGTPDFELQNIFGSYALFDDLNGGRVFGKTSIGVDTFLKITSGQPINSGVAGYGFASFAQAGVSVTYSNSIGTDAFKGGWSMGQTGLIGFKFTSGADTHFGWASVTLDGGAGDGFIINAAYYESTPGQSITAGQTVPEPASTALGLAGLAAGAAGLRRWRKAKTA